MIKWTLRRHDSLDPDYDQEVSKEIDETFLEDYRRIMETEWTPEVSIIQKIIQNMIFEAESRKE